MCGIACLLGAPEDRKLVEAMLERIEHRGREGRYFKDYSDGRAVLGMNRLALVSVGDGDQPTSNRSGTVHSVCNGMIYNHVSVRDREGPTNFPSKTDVGVIPYLYQKYGDGCVHRLDGTFAFVAYDERAQRFLAARDPFGVKPLYYVHHGGRWYFASEVKAFLVAGLHCDVQQVRIVLPGHYISCSLVAEPTPEQVPFYRLDVTKPVVPSTDHLFSLLDTAVKRKMLADPSVPIGVCLSGGIDSSIIAALACRHSSNLQAFTIGVEGSTDTEFAKLMARHLNLPLHVRTFTFAEIEKNLERAIYHLESYSPLLIVEGVMLMMLAELAASKNIKVLLAGTGADEIFAGYGVFRRKTPDEMSELGKRLLLNLHMTENRLADKTAMAHCVDSREPFLDPAVVEYAMRLPPSALVRPAQSAHDRPVEKWILRQAFGHLLPDVIRDRMKMAMDDGSGILAMVKGLEATVTDDELARVRRDEPEARVHDKITCYCYRVWSRKFGRAGGQERFRLFCEYPVLAESWSDAGGTGEDAEDLKLLSAERAATDHKQSASASATLVPSPSSSSSSSSSSSCSSSSCSSSSCSSSSSLTNGNGTCNNGTNGFSSPPRAKKQKTDSNGTANGNHNGNGHTNGAHNGGGGGSDDGDNSGGDGDFAPRRKTPHKAPFTATDHTMVTI